MTGGTALGLHTTRSAGACIPLLKQAYGRGIRLRLVQAVDNAGVAIDARQVDPAVRTITRFTTFDQMLQGVDLWMSGQQRATAAFILGQVLRKLNSVERSAATYLTWVNEVCPNDPDQSGWDPRLGRKPYPAGWLALGDYYCEMIRQAAAEGVRLAMPGFAFGTPEWSEMVALVASGFPAELGQAGGLLTFHEGAQPRTRTPMSYGPIPGAPSVPGAGPLFLRYRYFAEACRQGGVAMPDTATTEIYFGGEYNAGDLAYNMQVLAAYDAEVRADPYYLAFLPFTITVPGDGWEQQDYTFLYGAPGGALDYAEGEKDVPSTVPAPTVIGVDVSGDGQFPGLPWPAWFQAGVRFAILKVSEGLRPDRYFPQHHAQAEAAGVWTWEYHALSPEVGAEAQVAFFMAHWPRGWRGPGVLDIETPGITRELLTAACDCWDRLTTRKLWIYTRASAWRELIGDSAARFAKYGLWVAGGPGYEQPSAVHPPLVGSVSIPDIWTAHNLPYGYDLWQFASKGRLPEYWLNIDLNVFPGSWLDLALLWLSEGEGPMDDTQIATLDAGLNQIQSATTAQAAAAAQTQAAITTMRAALHPAPPGEGRHTMSLLTNQQVINLFNLTAHLPLAVLEAQLTAAQVATLYAKDARGQRSAFYTGPALEDMPTLTATQLAALIQALDGAPPVPLG